MKRARVDISLEFLREWLQMPDAVEILDVALGPVDRGVNFKHTLSLSVSHPQIPDVADSDVPPVVQVLFTKNYDDGSVTAEWSVDGVVLNGEVSV